MSNFSFVSHQYEISPEIKIVRKSETDHFQNANTDLVFNILSYSTEPDNTLNMKILFQLTFYPKHSANKYLLGLESQIKLIDHNRAVEKDLFSDESIRVIANFYKVNGEHLMNELVSDKALVSDYVPTLDELNIDQEVAIMNTTEIMLSYKKYLEGLN